MVKRPSKAGYNDQLQLRLQATDIPRYWDQRRSNIDFESHDTVQEMYDIRHETRSDSAERPFARLVLLQPQPLRRAPEVLVHDLLRGKPPERARLRACPGALHNTNKTSLGFSVVVLSLFCGRVALALFAFFPSFCFSHTPFRPLLGVFGHHATSVLRCRPGDGRLPRRRQGGQTKGSYSIPTSRPTKKRNPAKYKKKKRRNENTPKKRKMPARARKKKKNSETRATRVELNKTTASNQ